MRKPRPTRTVADLKVSAGVVRQLHALIESFRHGERKGFAALFSGPPGTGKAMAAEAVAGELGLALHKADLNAVVSKYIGETEKNLRRLFDEAVDSNAVLLFDEADAWFGKRSEAKDSHDRYANIEISYLLERIEEHPGLVILTTNVTDDLDEAFLRRVRFSVDFWKTRTRPPRGEYSGLKRVRYFVGQLLDADEFKQEQSYFREKQRRHNRFLHGWGVVSGLDVSINEGKVFVEPGMAIDCAGNDIFLEARQELEVPEGWRELFLFIEYCETETDPVPSYPAEGSAETASENSRILEGCRVDLLDADPNPGHDEIGPGTRGCGREHPLTIAHLQEGPGGWAIVPRGRRGT